MFNQFAEVSITTTDFSTLIGKDRDNLTLKKKKKGTNSIKETHQNVTFHSSPKIHDW